MTTNQFIGACLARSSTAHDPLLARLFSLTISHLVPRYRWHWHAPVPCPIVHNTLIVSLQILPPLPTMFDCVVQRNGQTTNSGHLFSETSWWQLKRTTNNISHTKDNTTVDSLNAIFKTIPETYIVEFLREAGFFYLIWCNLLTSTTPQTCTIRSDFSNYLENESNSETHLV